MKALCKYAFLDGLYVRGPVFVIIFIMNTVFILLGSLGLLPYAAHITAVSLGGIAIAVMITANIIGDVSIISRIFTAPAAYLYALTPMLRWKVLLAGSIAMAVMDLITMTFVICSQVLLSFNMIGFNDIWGIIIMAFSQNFVTISHILLGILLLIAAYLLIVQLVLFCVTVKKSILYKVPASGLLVFLAALVCIYGISLLQLSLLPFASVNRYRIFFILTLSSHAALIAYVLLTLLEAVGFFILTSKLFEKKVNI